MAWHQQFREPVLLADGRKLRTIREAAMYVTSLPKADQLATEWQTAAELLMLIGEHGGDPMMARIAMMKGLHRHEPRSASAPHRKRAKAYRIVR
jgi:hypothetical protein